MSYVVTVQPTIEPVTLSEAKEHLRVASAFTDDDVYITSLITMARQFVENYTRRSMLTQTIEARYDGFPAYFALERAPVKSITSIQYIDTNGNTQTLATSKYDFDQYSTPPRITKAYGETWPSTRAGVPNAVTVTYVSGEALAADVPRPLYHAILLTLAHFYENRESVVVGKQSYEVPYTIEALLMPYRVY